MRLFAGVLAAILTVPAVPAMTSEEINMEYIIKPHKIACIITVSCYGQEFECMYTSEDSPPQCRPATAGLNEYSSIHFYALPDSVRNAINNHWNLVFSIPNDGRRGKFVDSLVSFTVNSD